MKNLLILVSVLSLAACGGGSGGGAGMSDFDRAAISNAKITGMVSRIQDGDTYGSLSRSASGRAASMRDVSSSLFLNDVLFKSADKEYDTNIDEDFRMRFDVDSNGRIQGITFVDDNEEGYIARTPKDTNEFELVSDEETIRAYVNLFGAQKGLKYSDFGFIDIHGIGHDESGNEIITTQFIMPIAGGYDHRNVTANMNHTNFSEDVVFNGIAVADVGEPNTMISGERLTLRDNNATLTFKQDTGNEIFNAHFRALTDETTGVNYSDWYDVTATRYNNGDAQIEFDTPDGVTIPTGFEMNGSGRVENNVYDNQLSVEFNYYGDSANAPQEATGIIHYQCPGCKPFLMGFGGVVQQ